MGPDTRRLARLDAFQAALPGTALIAMIGSEAFWLHRMPVAGVLSGLILSIVLGMAYRNTVGLLQASSQA